MNIPRIDIQNKIESIGYRNLKDCSKHNGYNYQSVFTTVTSWANRTDREPHGELTREIMKKSRTEINFQLFLESS